ncbi:MAG: zinc ribbon domain-containing protein [Planctomycetes bacterium]|nr:zinc ribbon domain-containing protein [Planctomycetota bacterium]
MPVYEYRCRKCDEKFEELVRNERQKIACPKCRTKKVEKLFSVFGIGLPGAGAPAGGGGCGGCSGGS